MTTPASSPAAPATQTPKRPSAAAAPRPHLDERRDYVPRARVERFIVPLLARAIDEALTHWATLDDADKGRALALDVGCGRQPWRGRLEQQGYRYVGLDTQQNADQPVDVVAEIDAPLPSVLRPGSFHLVLCTEVLEHVADWPSAFSNIAALLAPGGRAIVTCPAVYPLHEEPYDFWRPTVHALRHHAERRGLRVVELSQLGSHWDVLGTLVGGLSIRSSRARPWSGLVVALLARPLKGLLFRLLRSGWLQRHAATRPWVYLSNLAVLERPRELAP
ncbi:class I SAM-dependent methyltransferase [Leptolyngbya sp. 15MV]|nr:class I SAM-dependent methyltransferase [Leptolyngbya sp. 15MV]